jgi:hypothetical protein
LTEAGLALGSVVSQLGQWGQRWYRTTFAADELDVGVLMWDMRCTVDPTSFPPTRTIVQFRFPDAARGVTDWWLVNENCEVDFCPFDPGSEVDLLVVTTLRTMTRVWMGDEPLDAALRAGSLELMGSKDLKHRFARWLRRSPYADIVSVRVAGQVGKQRCG